MAGQGVGDIVKELAHPAFIHHFAENDEQNDIGGGHLDGGAVYAVNIRGQIGHYPLPGVAPVHENTGELPPEEGIQQENHGQNRQGPAAEPPGGDQHQNNQNRAVNNINGFPFEAGGNKHRIADKHINRHGNGDQNHNPVIPGYFLPAGFLKGRIQGKAQHENHAYMDGMMLDIYHL